MKCISVVNQKGGVGKTTTALNLAASLAFYGQRVLLIDLDPQANATSGLGFDKRSIENTVYELIMDNQNLDAVIQSTIVKNLSLVPSRIDLLGAEIELISRENREKILKERLAPLAGKYDTIFIDCPPSLGLLTLNALCASDGVLIPIQCEYYAMEGLSLLLDTVDRVKESLNPTLAIEGVALTMFDSRVKLSTDVVGEIKKMFPEKMYETMIPRNVRLAEAPSFGKPVFLYDFASRGSHAYMQLAQEFMRKNGFVSKDPNATQETPVANNEPVSCGGAV